MLNLRNIPGGMISGLNAEELRFVSRESNSRFVSEINHLEETSTSSESLVELSDEDLRYLDQLEKDAVPKSTELQMRVHVQRFRDFLSERHLCADFERVPDRFLNDYLRLFYSTLRKNDGSFYAPKSLICIRAAIQRHLVSPSVNRTVNIITGDAFLRANGVLIAMVKSFLQSQPEKKIKFDAISEFDMQKIRKYFDRSNLRKLQDETIFNILLHFGLRGRENLRELTPACFERVENGTGSYLRIAVALLSKNVKASLNEKAFEDVKLARMYCLPNKDACPVEGYLRYIDQLPDGCPVLFPNIKKSGFSAKQVLGKDSLGDFMKNMSTKLGLSRTYTNHCVRVTTVTSLANSGFSNHAISMITGHKRTESVDVYKRRDYSVVEKMSLALSTFGQTMDNTEPDSVVTESGGNVSSAGDRHATSVSAPYVSGQFQNCTFNFFPKQ